MIGEQFFEGVFQSWVFRDELAKGAGIGFQFEMVHSPDRGNGNGFNIPVRWSEKFNISPELRANVGNRFFYTILFNVKPAQS